MPFWIRDVIARRYRRKAHRHADKALKHCDRAVIHRERANDYEAAAVAIEPETEV